jgi:hypothetical protein
MDVTHKSPNDTTVYSNHTTPPCMFSACLLEQTWCMSNQLAYSAERLSVQCACACMLTIDRQRLMPWSTCWLQCMGCRHCHPHPHPKCKWTGLFPFTCSPPHSKHEQRVLFHATTPPSLCAKSSTRCGGDSLSFSFSCPNPILASNVSEWCLPLCAPSGSPLVEGNTKAAESGRTEVDWELVFENQVVLCTRLREWEIKGKRRTDSPTSAQVEGFIYYRLGIRTSQKPQYVGAPKGLWHQVMWGKYR